MTQGKFAAHILSEKKVIHLSIAVNPFVGGFNVAGRREQPRMSDFCETVITTSCPVKHTSFLKAKISVYNAPGSCII